MVQTGGWEAEFRFENYIWTYLLVSNLTKKQTQAHALPKPSGTYRAMFACSTTALFLCTEKSTRKTHPPLAQ